MPSLNVIVLDFVYVRKLLIVYFRIPGSMLSIGKQPTDSTQSNTTINKPLPQSNNSYVVALSIWEQTIGASVNVMQLQCWTKTLGPHFSLVEPHFKVHASRLGFSFGSTRYTDIRLSSVYDMESWYKLWPERGLGELAPFVSKEKFIDEITKFEMKVVSVEFQYPGEECKQSWNTSEDLKDLKHYRNLNVTRTVCVKVGKKPSNVKSMIFGDDGDHNSTVLILHNWRGIRANYNFTDLPTCSNREHFVHLEPSKQVLEDAESYASKHFGGFEKYISVSARFEMITSKFRNMSQNQMYSQIQTVINDSYEVIYELREKYSLNTTYLSFDFGCWGSDTFKGAKYYGSSELLTKFQKVVYRGRMSLREYEQSFTTLKYQHPAYVAMVQMVLVSRGKCLLRIGTIGKSSAYVVSLFKKFHEEPYCVRCLPQEECQNVFTVHMV